MGLDQSLSKSQGIVLIADDTAESLTFMNEALAGAGYTVLVAMDGEQALNIARRMPPDLILLDALMPRMDGFETCQALKQDQELQDIPVIFLTGLSDSADVIRGLEAGGVDYLTKPVNLDEMLARVQVHISTAQKTKSVRMALEEMAQPAFAVDVHGDLLWITRCAQDLIERCNCSEAHLQTALQEALPSWLVRSPERNATLRLNVDGNDVQVRFLGRPLPGEFLLRLVVEDEGLLLESLRRELSLTEREAEVMLWISRGKTNQEIGQILSMSPRTVNKHLEPVFRKLGVENRTAAAAMALGVLGQQ
ncbi:MAG: response regulator transcription factor [Thalassolituus sp.]